MSPVTGRVGALPVAGRVDPRATRGQADAHSRAVQSYGSKRP
jgi:hypothetical protein